MKKITVLLLEDNLTDADLIEALLKTEGFDLDLKRVDTEHDFRHALQTCHPTLIISDFSLPSYNGAAALELARKFRPGTPVIFFSGTIGEEAAVEALKLGATDYVLKQRPGRLVSAVQRALADAEMKTRQVEAEQRIKSQAQLLDLAMDAIMVLDLENRVTFWNRGAERLYGITRAEAAGRKVIELIYHPSGLSSFELAREQLLQSGYWEGELEQRTRDNRVILVTSHYTLVRGENGLPEKILAISTDITEKKQLEKQFFRAQRLESVGTLASGIAHDLNNILAPIFMAGEILRDEPLSPEGLEMVRTVQHSAQRGADMVKQILTFVRGTEGKRSALRLEFLLREIAKVASETFPKNIRTRCEVAPGLWPVIGDATQIHQVLMNLCVNARDALPKGGQITLCARNLQGDPPRVALEVEDTGTGIPPEILDKIFDPFFSTKEVGKGTGLGLSTVLGIVKTHGGNVEVESHPGKGTRFSVVLPAVPNHSSETAAGPALPVPKGRGELILMVDDEEEFRKTATQALLQHGYEVILAEDGSAGVVQFAANRDKIRLVVTDLNMPGLDGFAFAKTILALKPALKIVVTSGVVEPKGLPEGARLLGKPFTAEALLRAVHEALGSAARP